MEGTRLGPYRLLAELGSGGMGKVFRAEVAGPVPGLDAGCAVALKVIHAHLLETPGFFKRFLREADLGRTIEHENVVRTYDCDALLHDGTQQNFLVMEYVEGQTLRDLLQELERVPEELCRHIGREVAKGLAAIHEAGVVHRDLKPENVLITPDHVVKIMDLGVARLQAEAVRLSQTGAFVGSLEYAAPEQFRSSDGEPDGRADLHALGVLLYELTTGQHPYRDEDAAKVIGHILNDTPRKAGELNPQLSPFFEEVLVTLMEKDRDARLDSASTLSLVLEEGEKSDWWKARAKALRVETKRPLRRIRIPRETALYGRDDDLAKLQSLYEKAKDADGRVLLIEGEAGIGKTRLVDEFVGRLRQQGEDVNFLFGSYPPGGAATAAGAFSEAYREQFGAEGLEDTLKDYLTPTPILIPAFAAILKGETTPKDAEQLTKDSLQTVFVHATRGLATERTTIVLIDDLHFAPEDGRALFTSLAMACPGHRILLLGTMRPDVPEDWIANVERLDHAGRAVLSRLGPKDLVALLKDAFRSERLARELALQISEKSDGNPFFAFEIIRGLREGQFIAQQPDGTWVTTKVIQDIQVPSSVLDLVNARVAALTEEERDLLDVASCCGFEFDPTLVGDVLGLPRVAALKRFGQVERRHRLVRSAGRDYKFDHHQVQEALYGSLNERLREEYHSAIAGALEARLGASQQDAADLPGALCLELCRHSLEGAQYGRLRKYLGAALAHLRALHRHEQVIELAGRALATPAFAAGKPRLETLLSKADSLSLVWRQNDALDAARESVLLARELGDSRSELIATAGRGIALYYLSRYDEAKASHERWRTLAQEIGDRGSAARATGNLGNVALARGRYREALSHYERYNAIAREEQARFYEASSLIMLGPLLAALGDAKRAKTVLDEALAISRATNTHNIEGYALHDLALVADEEGDRGRAEEYMNAAIVVRRRVGHMGGLMDSLLALGDLRRRWGEVPAARAALEEGIAIARERELKTHVSHGLASMACLPDQDPKPALAALSGRPAADMTPEIHHLIFLATGKHEHLVEAKRLLDYRVEHAPEEYRESMLKNVRLNREIMEAWAEHGQET